MNLPQRDSKQAQFQNWDAEKADLKVMRYLWEQNMCPPEARLYDGVELQHNGTHNGESSRLDAVLVYLSSHAKLLHRTLKLLESTRLPFNASVNVATECLDQGSSTAMKDLMPRIIASGHVANVIQLINHATSLLGLLKFFKEQQLDVMFRDINAISRSVYQFIVKIGEKIIPL